MASIQDVANAAYRIKDNANHVQRRTQTCADSLKNNSQKLSASVRGSKTGEDAVRQVNEAERAVRQCAARLLTLQSDIDRFIVDLTK